MSPFHLIRNEHEVALKLYLLIEKKVTLKFRKKNVKMFTKDFTVTVDLGHRIS